jgi:hypothetical protein
MHHNSLTADMARNHSSGWRPGLSQRPVTSRPPGKATGGHGSPRRHAVHGSESNRFPHHHPRRGSVDRDLFRGGASNLSGGANGVPPSIDLFNGADIFIGIIFIGIIFMVITLTLQSMCIRDIGWIRSASGEPRRPDPAPRGGSNSGAAERLARVRGEFGRRTLR